MLQINFIRSDSISQFTRKILIHDKTLIHSSIVITTIRQELLNLRRSWNIRDDQDFAQKNSYANKTLFTVNRKSWPSSNKSVRDWTWVFDNDSFQVANGYSIPVIPRLCNNFLLAEHINTIWTIITTLWTLSISS